MKRSYKVLVCGEVMSLFVDGRKHTTSLKVAKMNALKFMEGEKKSSISIHAFDKQGNFDFVVAEWEPMK